LPVGDRCTTSMPARRPASSTCTCSTAGSTTSSSGPRGSGQQYPAAAAILPRDELRSFIGSPHSPPPGSPPGAALSDRQAPAVEFYRTIYIKSLPNVLNGLPIKG